MSNIYIYPKENYEILESPNPYVPNIESALTKKHVIINKKPSSIGVLNMLLHLLKTDIYFFNWIENLSMKRFGKPQTVLFIIFIFLSKLLRKKIVWVLHNIYSHEKENHGWTKIVFRNMIKNSDMIITHSMGGVEFVKEKFPVYSPKVKYIIHPVEKMFTTKPNENKQYDFLIWGTIHPYKGVIEFLDFVKESPKFQKLKILISGICPNKQLHDQLSKYINENISHIDKFQDMEEIAILASQSKYVLFTYNSKSILSSGSLMDSIRMGATIIGPDRGSFKDLNTYNFIKTYKTYQDILDIYENQNFNIQSNYKEIETFCNENSWEKFEEKLFEAGEHIL